MPKNNSLTLKVRVTAEDIRLGCPEDSENCPVARAVLRALTAEFLKSKVGRFFVDGLSVEVGGGGVDVVINYASFTTKVSAAGNVEDFVAAFDHLPNLQSELEDAEYNLEEVLDEKNRRAVYIEQEAVNELKAQIKNCKAKIKPFSLFLTLFPN